MTRIMRIVAYQLNVMDVIQKKLQHVDKELYYSAFF